MATSEGRIERLLVHDGFIRGLARRLIADGDSAEDVAQDAWVELLAKRRKDVASLPSWLAGVVRNVASKRRRGEARRRARQELAARDEAVPSAAEILARESARARVVQAVLALDEPYRSTMLLRYFEGLPPRAIARRQRVPVETVRTRIKRALATLRETLDREFGERGAWCALLLPWTIQPPRDVPWSFPTPSEIASPLPLITAMKIALGIATLTTISVLAYQALRTAPNATPQRVLGAPISAARELSEPPRSGDEVLAVPAQAAVAARTAEPGDAAEPAAETSGTIRVRVTWSDGSPAAGVGVRVESTSHASPAFYLVETRTDEQGECSCEARAGGAYVQVDRIELPARVSLEPGEEELVEVEIPAGFTLRGVVLDAEGRTVAGADVLLSRHMNPADGGIVVARSGASGEFEIRSCDDGFYLGARAAGHVPSLLQLLLADEGTTLRTELVLRGVGAMLEGTVLDPDGRGVANALVVAGGAGARWGQVLTFGRTTGVVPDALVTRTDASGRFRLEGLETGEVALGVRAPGFGTWRGTTEVQAGRTSERDVWLTSGVALAGRVLNDRGEPVAGADVEIGGDHTELGSWTRTASDGSFRFEDLEPGTIEVGAESDCGTASASIRLQGAPGDELVWEAVLSEHVALHGRVVDESGAPLGNCRIEVFDQAMPAEGEPEFAMADTDAMGKFEATNLHARPHVVHVFAPGHYIFPSATLHDAVPGEGDLEIVVEAARMPSICIAGSIRGEDGLPATGVQILPWLSTHTNGTYGTVDASGRFELGPYPAGTWTLQLTAQGVPELSLGPKELGVGETWDLGELVLGAEGFRSAD
jgi:RNA polymerase sigma-70 factor (ECF subfamily)